MLPKSKTSPARRMAFATFVFVWVAMASVAESSPRVVHVFVALADNQHQGIVPVSAVLGNGNDPKRNLYWGTAYGVKTFFKSSEEWQLLFCGRGPKDAILERCVFKHGNGEVFLVADAYQGSEIKLAVTDFLSAAAGITSENIRAKVDSADVSFAAGGAADLLAYVGHDAFMDFQIPPIAGAKGNKPRRTIVLACAS